MNPWKVTAIGMILVLATAVITGVIVGVLPSGSVGRGESGENTTEVTGVVERVDGTDALGHWPKRYILFRSPQSGTLTIEVDFNAAMFTQAGDKFKAIVINRGSYYEALKFRNLTLTP